MSCFVVCVCVCDREEEDYSSVHHLYIYMYIHIYIQIYIHTHTQAAQEDKDSSILPPGQLVCFEDMVKSGFLDKSGGFGGSPRQEQTAWVEDANSADIGEAVPRVSFVLVSVCLWLQLCRCL